MTVTELLLLLVFGLSMMALALAAHIISERFAGEPDMGEDNRDPSREELIRKIAGEIDLHYPLVMVASEAILDIILKTVAGEVLRLSDEWYKECRAGHKANTHLEGKSDGADECATAILALTSEGVKE